jgi:hypothetical protein
VSNPIENTQSSLLAVFDATPGVIDNRRKQIN